MRVVPVIVAYFTPDWIRVAITSYLRHFPDDRVLVVDNNPLRAEAGWMPACERERRWLRSHPRVDYVMNHLVPCSRYGGRPHGLGLDAALGHCRDLDADVLLHLEPDCVVTGTRWRENLLGALADGAWMAGSHRQEHGPIHPCPSAWRVDRVRSTFAGWEWEYDARHPRFHELVDLDRLKAVVGPGHAWDVFWSLFWDTGHKAWFDAAVHDRAALVDAPDFRHYWHGSIERRMDEAALVARYPELEPWFRLAETVPPRRVEDCPHREDVRREAASGDEVARCHLLRLMLGADDDRLADVHRSACVACSAAPRPSPYELNPVVASLLMTRCERVIDAGGVPGCDLEKAVALAKYAERGLDFHIEPVPWPS